METDADRLASIKVLGGQLVSSENGDFWAIFDEPGAQVTLDDSHFNSTSPQLTLRSSDVSAFQLSKRGTPVSVGTDTYIIRERQKGDAPGWSVLVLSEP